MISKHKLCDISDGSIHIISITHSTLRQMNVSTSYSVCYCFNVVFVIQ